MSRSLPNSLPNSLPPDVSAASALPFDTAIDSSMHRRTFLRRSLFGAAAVSGGMFSSALFAQTPTPAQAPVPAPLPASPATDSLKLSATSLTRALRAEAKPSQIFALNDAFPAREIRVKAGASQRIALENGLAQPLHMSIFGLRGKSANLGIVGLNGQYALKQGEKADLSFQFPHAGTFLALPLIPAASAEMIERGLIAPLVVEEANPPQADADQCFLLDDWRLSPEGELQGAFLSPMDAARSGRLGNALVVNGKIAPETVKLAPNARIRVRLINVSNARIMPMKFEGLRASVIAIDGHPCDPFDPLRKTIVLSPLSRYDIMIDAPSVEGAQGHVMVAIGNGFSVINIIAEGKALSPRAEVVKLADTGLPPEIRLQNATRIDIALSGGLPAGYETPSEADMAKLFPDPAKIWKINGIAGNGFSGAPLFKVRRGSAVVLSVRNTSLWNQTIRFAGHPFRMLHPYDDGWEPYFLDFLYLAQGQMARIALNADDIGAYAVHSTILEHFGTGLSGWFEITA